jgi:hypothetical protein
MQFRLSNQWEWHVQDIGGMRKAYKILVGKLERDSSLSLNWWLIFKLVLNNMLVCGLDSSRSGQVSDGVLFWTR